MTMKKEGRHSMKTITLLDTTLRDGSYAINFRFSASDVENICLGLEQSGVDWIELGHGVGLGANRSDNEPALCSDEEYLCAAEKCLTTAKYGMFCIPGIAGLDDLRMAASHGMSFVRIGSNVQDVQNTAPFISLAKKLGMTVSANYMKSYTASPEQFAEKVRFSEDCGADCIYIVDSAGGMLPKQLMEYADAIRKVSNIKLGFHGHDNLGLAVANSLYCADLGFDLIDVSLCGMGRSSGNAAAEILLPVLVKAGYEIGIDWFRLMAVSSKYIMPLISNKHINPIDIVCGFSGFHTSYMKHIHRCANDYRVNPLKLIIEYCKVDQVDLDYSKLCKIAETLPKVSQALSVYRFNEYYGSEQTEKGQKRFDSDADK